MPAVPPREADVSTTIDPTPIPAPSPHAQDPWLTLALANVQALKGIEERLGTVERRLDGIEDAANRIALAREEEAKASLLREQRLAAEADRKRTAAVRRETEEREANATKRGQWFGAVHACVEVAKQPWFGPAVLFALGFGGWLAGYVHVGPLPSTSPAIEVRPHVP
jgi:hypothetical protein